jgi:hypothetical protein
LPGEGSRPAPSRPRLSPRNTSRRWTGKTLAEHAAERAASAEAILSEAGIIRPDRDRCSAAALAADGTPRYQWSRVGRHDGDAITYAQAIAASTAERARWRDEYACAKSVRNQQPNAA